MLKLSDVVVCISSDDGRVLFPRIFTNDRSTLNECIEKYYLMKENVTSKYDV